MAIMVEVQAGPSAEWANRIWASHTWDHWDNTQYVKESVSA